jgi:hypothetical protein
MDYMFIVGLLKMVGLLLVICAVMIPAFYAAENYSGPKSFFIYMLLYVSVYPIAAIYARLVHLF